MGTRATIPKRSDLLDQIQRANNFAWMIVAIEVILIVAITVFIDWKHAIDNPLIPTIAIGAMVGGFFMQNMRHLVSKKKRISDLRESTRFGEYDKHKLAQLFRDTLARLKLPDENIPVFIVANRSMNAMSMHVGLGSLFKSINGIYLFRQVLHKLDPFEVQDLMGHELGHFYRYYLVSDRFRFLTVVLGALVGVFGAQLLGVEGFLGYFMVVVLPALFWTISMIPYSRNAEAIEYLCDDMGAQVHGITTSIQGLLKLGRDAEVELAVLQQAVFSKSRGTLSPSEIVDAVFETIPYGDATREEIHERVQKEIQTRATNKTASVGGFLNYVWNSDREADAEEELVEQAKLILKLQSLPRLDWEAILQDRSRIRLDDNSTAQLIKLIESHPNELLFRIPEVVGKTDNVHPPLQMRILYLWHNRREIELARGRA